MNFSIQDESHFTSNELLTIKEAVEEFGNKDLAGWKFGTITCTIGNLQKGDVPIYITKRNRKPFASAYHTVENGKPAIYVLPRVSINRFGFYSPAQPSRKIGIFTRPARKEVKDAGMITSLLHEVAEVLGDPLLNTESAPDSLGRRYHQEIADPVFGINYVKKINGINCVFPAVVLPNWYLLGSTAPYDTAGYCTAPFQKSPKGYAYWVKIVGKVKSLVKV